MSGIIAVNLIVSQTGKRRVHLILLGKMALSGTKANTMNPYLIQDDVDVSGFNNCVLQSDNQSQPQDY